MMANHILSALIFLSLAHSGAMAETIIAMPVPPAMTSGSAIATGQTPGAATGLFSQGIEALDRYSAKAGRPRHQYSTSLSGVGSSRRSGPRQFYSSYRGPAWGWGWGGYPIFVNNYWCGQPRPGRGACRLGGFTGISVGF